MFNRYILDKHLNDVYDVEGYTTSEVLCQFYEKIREIITEVNKVTINNEEFKKVVSQKIEYLLGEGLALEVADNITEMYNDGRLETIINQEVFGNINQRLEDTSNLAESNERKIAELDRKTVQKLAEMETSLNNKKTEIDNTLNTKTQEINSNLQELRNYVNTSIDDVNNNMQTRYQIATNFEELKQCIEKINNGTVKTKVVKLLSGTYSPTESLELTKETQIIGEGTVVFECDTGVNNIFRNKATGYNSYSAHGRIQIKNIYFRGNGTTNTITPIAFAHSNHCIVEHCTFTNFNTSWHMIEINSSKNMVVENCEFTNIGELNGNNTEVIQVDFAGSENQYPWIITLDETHCNNISIINNTFNTVYSKTGVIGNHTYSNSNQHSKIFITNNYFYKCQNCYYLLDSKEVSICNNKFYNCLNGIKLKNVNNQMQDIIISNNTFEGDRDTKYFGDNTDGRFIWSVDNTGYILRVVANGNIVTKTTRHGIGGPFKDSVFNGNTFTDIGDETNPGFCVYLFGCNRCNVIGNVFNTVRAGCRIGGNAEQLTNNCVVAYNSGTIPYEKAENEANNTCI